MDNINFPDIPVNDQRGFYLSTADIRGLIGGNRCLGGETLIYDPIAKTTNRVDSIDSDFHVFAWNNNKLCIAKAKRPFIKGVDDLYGIKLSTGEKFVASMSHLVLTDDGYLPLSQCPVGCAVFRPPSNSVFSPSIHVLNAYRWIQKAKDSINYCLNGFRLYGEQPRLALNNDQDVSPLQGDVPGHTSGVAFGQTDDSRNKCECNPPYQRVSLLANLDDQPQTGGRFAGILYHVFYKPFGLALHLTRFYQQSIVVFSRLLSIAGFSQQGSQLHSTLASFFLSGKSSIITNKTYLRRDVKWDFHVPEYNNYLAGGIIHHNSMKTESGSIDVLRFGLGEHPIRSKHRQPPVHVRICAPKYEDGCKGVILKKFRTLIPHYQLLGSSWVKAWSEKEKRLTLANGSSYNFKSYEMDVNTYGGDDIDAWWMDEHGDWRYYIENQARLPDRSGGYAILTMTPEAGQTWEEDILTDPPDGITAEYWFFDTRGNPFLSKDGVEKLMASLQHDEALFDTKIRGQFAALSGMVLPQWNPQVHIIPDRKLHPDAMRIFCIDLHIKTPSAAMWVGKEPDGKYYVYRTAKKIMTVPEWKKYIRIKSAGERIDLWLGDETESEKTGTNIYGLKSIISEFNTGRDALPIVQVTKGQGSFAARTYRLRNYLAPEAVTQKSRIYVFRSCDYPLEYINGKPCGSLAWEIKHYVFKREQKADEETLREKVRKVNDHYIDDLGYIIMTDESTHQTKKVDFGMQTYGV